MDIQTILGNPLAIGGLYLLLSGSSMHLLAVVVAKPTALRKTVSLGGAGISCACIGAALLGIAVGIESVVAALIVTAPSILTEVFAAIYDRTAERGVVR